MSDSYQVDLFSTFEKGVNNDVAPQLLPKNQLSSALNCTMRGTFVSHRPPFSKLAVDMSLLPPNFRFQGAAYYKSDSGVESLMAAISGRLYQFVISDDVVSVLERSSVPGVHDMNPASYQHWMWQAEKWLIWNDGTSSPMFFDGSTASRSNYGLVSYFSTTIGGTYVVTNYTTTIATSPIVVMNLNQIGAGFVVDAADIQVNDLIQFGSYGQGLVTAVDYVLNKITFKNISQKPVGANMPVGTTLSWTHMDGIPAYIVQQGLTVQAVGVEQSGIKVGSVADLAVGDIVTLASLGQMTVTAVDVGNNSFSAINSSCHPVGSIITSGTVVSWRHSGIQLPPGRMGDYGMGRNWICLADGKQFLASDSVGFSSGTQANNYRDSVLYITENTYLAGGGNFTVPGSIGDITFMRFTSALDASLGQGPLQVGTTNSVFSCQSPVERLAWQDVTNPILAQSYIGHGGCGQGNTVVVNSDIITRSVDGLLSLTLARRDFEKWGSSLISNEVAPILRRDSPDLLQYGSSVSFDNRLLVTCSPVLSDSGIYHLGVVPILYDNISTLQGKSPPAYDSLAWSGLNIFQMVTGTFGKRQRCFAFGLNLVDSSLELYEIGTELSGVYDNANVPINWSFETGTLFNQKDSSKRIPLRLSDGEVYVDNLTGTVEFQAFYKPDQWNCWVPWFSWSECSAGGKQFRPRMGLGEPSSRDCDASNGRQLRDAYSYQFKLVVRGHCRVLGAKLKASVQPEPAFAKPQCQGVCP
jgi:hypothetical protein